MNLKKSILTVTFASVLTSGAAFGESKRSIGDVFAQCGLGGLIGSAFEEDETTADFVAISTNVTWDLGTTAASSNSSSPGTCARKNVKVASYIKNSYPQIEKDLAVGQGAYIDGLLDAMEVSKNRIEIASSIRSELAQTAQQPYFEALSQEKKADILYQIVQSKI